ncbi:MAG: 16S rRNA (cytosine(1402)-N(4))-methyltransferase RsmH [Chthoniobacterales bacterium]
MADEPKPYQRRPRYRGKNPRRFEEKYKERAPERYGDTIAKVLASGKTPAGSHRPIMVTEILEALAPKAGELAVDCTLGFGGHAEAILPHLQPGGHLIGVDVDPVELPKTEARLRGLGFGSETFTARRSNFAGITKVLGSRRADLILADLGVSSMQLDDPTRGFSMKHDGPLDMRMNPERGEAASALVAMSDVETLTTLLSENADEPYAAAIADAIAGRRFSGTRALRTAIEAAVRRRSDAERELAVRRSFQALRIAVNDEFAALDSLLRVLPLALSSRGRVAILSFHSGEDRRAKKAFAAGLRAGDYIAISHEVIRPGSAERHANPRSVSAKLRWAQRV